MTKKQSIHQLGIIRGRTNRSRTRCCAIATRRPVRYRKTHGKQLLHQGAAIEAMEPDSGDKAGRGILKQDRVHNGSIRGAV